MVNGERQRRRVSSVRDEGQGALHVQSKLSPSCVFDLTLPSGGIALGQSVNHSLLLLLLRFQFCDLDRASRQQKAFFGPRRPFKSTSFSSAPRKSGSNQRWGLIKDKYFDAVLWYLQYFFFQWLFISAPYICTFYSLRWELLWVTVFEYFEGTNSVQANSLMIHYSCCCYWITLLCSST